jgi:penicillin-binding protein 1B
VKRLLAIAAGSLAAFAVALFAASLVQLAFVEVPSDLDLERAPRQASRLYSRPLALRVGEPLGADALEAHLVATAHRQVDGPEPARGEYSVSGGEWRIGARGFRHPTGDDPGGRLSVRLDRRGRIASLRSPRGERTPRLWLEPAEIGAVRSESGRDQLPVRLDALPEHLIDAVLAIEDHRFREHSGLDLRRIGGALLANLRAGRIVQGGSTLTQQLVKNLYLSRERSWFRKLQEAPFAVMLELRLTKRQILEAYLNEVYLGQSGGLAIHGVGRAAHHWFGRPASELALHESALLAGMLRGPSLYSPRRAPKLAHARRDLVLTRMYELGSISEVELDAARAHPLSVIPRRGLPASRRYFADSARARLLERYEQERLEQGGLAIFTSLDLRLQRIAERSVLEGVRRLEEGSPALLREDLPLQAALVALDPKSGQLLAMVGGRDYGASQFDRATEAKRQPGSVFKPVAALAALTTDRGEPPPYTLASLVEDAPIALETPEGDWQPGNHDGEFRGLVTLRQLVEHSLNVPMVRVGMELGPRRVVRAARRLGIESRLRGVPSLVLGTSEVTLLEMTRAYAVLAAEGWRAELRDVVGVWDASEEPLERNLAAGVQALDPAEAYLATSLLEGVVNRGTGAGLRAWGYAGPAAGKTGTTDDYRDAWFIGYAPELAVGVWVGFDDGQTLRHSGARAALPIFAGFFREALGAEGGRDFRVPLGVETVQVVAAEGERAGLRCSGDPEVFLSGTEPVERCDPWGWIADRRILRIHDYEAEDLPPVAALPGVAPRREPRFRFKLPSWLNSFVRRVKH